MQLTPTPEELAIYHEISTLAASLWDVSKEIVGLNTDPKMFSILLFKRLWSNHRTYTLLWNSRFYLEGDIILRSGVEAAICIAANFKLREKFVLRMRQDAAHTVLGQIKLHRENNESELVRDDEAFLRDLQSRLPEGVKPARLNWKTLADEAGVPLLYDFHRSLSSLSSHVTGFSILRGLAHDKQDELTGISRKMHLMMMAAATLHSSMLHAGMIDHEEYVRTSIDLTARLNALSLNWLDLH